MGWAPRYLPGHLLGYPAMYVPGYTMLHTGWQYPHLHKQVGRSVY